MHLSALMAVNQTHILWSPGSGLQPFRQDLDEVKTRECCRGRSHP